MKKYLSIVSLIALLAINNTYTAEPAGKPLTAQEKIRVNTLLVRQKHLNIDIQRLKDQGKKVPAAKDKDLMNVTNAINKYELRDPMAVAQIRKGFSTAAQSAVRPSVKPGKPSRPASKPSIRPTRPSAQPSRQPATKQINPIYDFPAEERLAPREPSPQPITPPKPALLEPVIKEENFEIDQPEKIKLLNKNNQLDQTALNVNKTLIKTMPKQQDRENKVYELLNQLAEDLNSSNPPILGSLQVQIHDKVKNELFPLILEAAKPISSQSKDSLPAKPQPAQKPSSTQTKPAQSTMEWKNLTAYVSDMNQMLKLKTDGENDPLVSNEWLSGVLKEAKNDKPNLGPDDIDAIVEVCKPGIQALIQREKENSKKGYVNYFANIQDNAEYDTVWALTLFLRDKIKEETKSLLPAAAPTGMSLFNGSQPNLKAIGQAAKATNAQNPKAAMPLVELSLKGSDLKLWQQNKDAIQNFLQHNWADL